MKNSSIVNKRHKYYGMLLCLVVVFTNVVTTSCEKLLEFDTVGNIVPATVDEDSLLPSIEINGTVLHAEAFMDIHNPIIIFLHGGPGSDYRALISQIGLENASRYPEKRILNNGGLNQLQDSYFCVFYDQRGSGLSPRFDKDDINFDIYLEDLNCVIKYYLTEKKEKTGVIDTKVNIFAWSFGGILSTGFINKYPDKVKDIVFYEPGPLTPEAKDYFLERMTSVFLQIGEEWLEGYLQSHEHITAGSHERADYQQMLGAFKGQPEFHQHPGCPLWRFGSVASKANLDFMHSDNYDITSNLHFFKGNALFIAGSYTVAEFPDYMQIQQKCYPVNNLIIVPDIGHTGPWEKPNEIASLIQNFFK